MKATARQQWIKALSSLTDIALLVYADEQGLLDLRRVPVHHGLATRLGIFYLWKAEAPKEISLLIEAECNRRTHLHFMLRMLPKAQVQHL